ncbi:MAG: biotin--[acetyl-CoA-carboxylase] ligase [Pseudodesulfovibrio sp.]
MLPSGIFLWKSGGGPGVPPTEPAEVAAAHPDWAAAMASLGPWKREVAEGGGVFLAGGGGEDGPVIVVVRHCATTMTAARFLARSGALGPWGCLVAVEQSQGRGQLRRPWVSSPGNLHLSVVLPAPPGAGEWGRVLPGLWPLVAGYLFSTVLRDHGVFLQIKWPNDLLQSGRKVGGILIEDVEGVVVLGMGLNLAGAPPDGQMREDRSVPAAVLEIPGHGRTALGLCQTLVSCGKRVYQNLLDDLTPSRFLDRVASRLAWFGQPVLVREGGEGEYRAVIKGLSSDGGLVLSLGAKETVLYSGSIFPL